MKRSLGAASSSGFPLAVVDVLGMETTRLSLNRVQDLHTAWAIRLHEYGVNASGSSGHASVMILPLRNLHKHSLSKGSATAEWNLRRRRAWASVKHTCIFSFSR